MIIGNKEFDAEEVVQAFIDVGLIQFDPNQPKHIMSVWGFVRWEHDHDLVAAIKKVRDPGEEVLYE